MLVEEVPSACGDYTVSVRQGSVGVPPRGPHVVYVSSQQPTPIGCYIYAVPGRNGDVHTAVLQASGDSGVHDLAHRLGRVLVKKSGRPSYVCVSGSVNEMDSMELMGRVVSLVGRAEGK